MRKMLALWAVSMVTLPAWADVVVNNNIGATGISQYTQSGSSTLVFGSTVIVAFNDSGSYAASNNQFTGYARSTDGGLTFTDMGGLPTNAAGDAGYAHLARHDATGTVYSTSLGFSSGQVQVLRSLDGGITFSPPTIAVPGATAANYNAIAVDNAAGQGNGTLYVVTEDFGDGGGGLRLSRSTDGGLTFGPSILLSSSGNAGRGPSITVGPDHRVTVAYLDTTVGPPVIRVRSSTDNGVTFAAPAIAATLAVPATGDLGLVGVRNGLGSATNFRSNAHPQIVANPVTGQLYMVYANKGLGADKADILLRTSGDGGLTWSAAQRVNSDAGSNDQWQPTITVTPDGKHVGIFWYDRRNDSANNLIEYYGRQCAVSATVLTCGADFAISDQPFLPEFGRDAIVTLGFMGDYDNADSDDNFFYVSWGDNRLPLAGGGDRLDPNVFFDRIAIGGIGGGGSVPVPATLWLAVAALFALAWQRRAGQVS
ncbi:MAG: sialidase family protein [Rubrivivax sp.]